MENEIRVGEYIRTLDGFIDKVIIEYKGKCNNPNCKEKHISCEDDYYCEKEVVKHSSNIIDLIEPKDYVNGEKVEKIAEPSLANDYKKIVYCNECEGLYKLVLAEGDIKKIVTKEQIKAIEYRVKE